MTTATTMQRTNIPLSERIESRMNIPPDPAEQGGRVFPLRAGANATLRNVNIKLGTPNLAGDTMTLSGTITSKENDEVTVEVAGKNSWGNHVTGSVRVALLQ